MWDRLDCQGGLLYGLMVGFPVLCDRAQDPESTDWHVSTFIALATMEVDALTGNCLFLALRQLLHRLHCPHNILVLFNANWTNGDCMAFHQRSHTKSVVEFQI